MKNEFQKGSEPGLYRVKEEVSEDTIIKMAKRIVRGKFKRRRLLSGTSKVKCFLTVELMGYEYETFGVIYLDSQHRILHMEKLFRGTIDAASVYPREVVKEALKHNAAALLLFHNHPSGVAEPSRSDKYITEIIKKACELVDIRVLDHIILGAEEPVSFAERGLL